MPGAKRKHSLLELLVATVIVGGLYAVLLDTFDNAKFPALTASCRSNLKFVGAQISLYQRAHQGKMPPSLRGVVGADRQSVLICPLSIFSANGVHLSYVYRRLDRPRPSDVIAWDVGPHTPMHSVFKWQNHPSRQVLRADGSISKLSEDEFAALNLRGKSERVDAR